MDCESFKAHGRKKQIIATIAGTHRVDFQEARCLGSGGLQEASAHPMIVPRVWLRKDDDGGRPVAWCSQRDAGNHQRFLNGTDPSNINPLENRGCVCARV